jgi:regulator of RNase E activity RraB
MANATDRSEIPAQLCTEIINSIVLEKSVVKAQQKRIQSISKKYHHGHRI